MCKPAVLLLTLSIAAFAVSVQAHEGKPHVMGTIAAVDASHIEVKTTDGKVVSAKLDDHTKYFKGDTPTTAADLKVGLRVVVHLAGHEKEATASEVHLPAEKEHKSSGGSQR